MGSSDHINITRNHNVLQLGIHRPEKKNALTSDMYDTLRHELESARSDPHVKSVLIYGTPEVFTSGNDLKDFDNRVPGVSSPGERFLLAIHAFEKPVVAAVSGYAVGIGSTMLLHCDLVYAAPDARFKLPFVNLGLNPEAGSTLLLPLNGGYKQAAEIFMLGEFFTTQKAIEIGLVNREVEKERLFEYALEQAITLASKPSEALLLTKKFLKKALQDTVTERIKEEGVNFGRMLQTQASIEARKKARQRIQKNRR